MNVIGHTLLLAMQHLGVKANHLHIEKSKIRFLLSSNSTRKGCYDTNMAIKQCETVITALPPEEQSVRWSNLKNNVSLPFKRGLRPGNVKSKAKWAAVETYPIDPSIVSQE